MSRCNGNRGHLKSELEKIGLDKVWLQPVMVPKWIRGNPEFAYIETAPGKTPKFSISLSGDPKLRRCIFIFSASSLRLTTVS